MRETELHYCPGCTHGIAHRLIMEVLEERGDLGNCIAVSPVGCSIVAHQYMNVDMMESPMVVPRCCLRHQACAS